MLSLYFQLFTTRMTLLIIGIIVMFVKRTLVLKLYISLEEKIVYIKIIISETFNLYNTSVNYEFVVFHVSNLKHTVAFFGKFSRV